MSWNPRNTSRFAKQYNSIVQTTEAASRRKTVRSIEDCIVIDVWSGEENPSDTNYYKHDTHVWWILETPGGSVYTVECGHDYDYIQANIGNVAAQQGRYATIYYRGAGKEAIENGWCEVQPDRVAQIPNPTGESIPFSIGALGGIFDSDALVKSALVGMKSKFKGPKV